MNDSLGKLAILPLVDSYFIKYMQQMWQLLQRARTFDDSLLYNHKLINPYLLASHGLVLARKSENKQSIARYATCFNQKCSLRLQFDQLDDEEEYKEQLQIVIVDHAPQCDFNRHNLLMIDYHLFKQLGNNIFQANLTALEKHQKYIQLSPTEIKNALRLQENSQGTEQKFNIQFQLFRKLDRNLRSQRLIKANSTIFLAIFGWNFTQNSQNQIKCICCGKSKNIFQHISPSECTMMNLPNGFQFISSHRPWCCLINPSTSFWKVILHRAVEQRISVCQGQPCLTQIDMKCKDIQQKSSKIFINHYSTWNNFKKRLRKLQFSFEKERVGSEQKDKRVKQQFKHSIQSLQWKVEECTEIVEKFVKRIKLT